MLSSSGVGQYAIRFWLSKWQTIFRLITPQKNSFRCQSNKKPVPPDGGGGGGALAGRQLCLPFHLTLFSINKPHAPRRPLLTASSPREWAKRGWSALVARCHLIASVKRVTRRRRKTRSSSYIPLPSSNHFGNERNEQWSWSNRAKFDWLICAWCV